MTGRPEKKKPMSRGLSEYAQKEYERRLTARTKPLIAPAPKSTKTKAVKPAGGK